MNNLSKLFSNKIIVIAGFGETGQSVLRFFERAAANQVISNIKIIILESQNNKSKPDSSLSITWITGDTEINIWADQLPPDLNSDSIVIIKSPGLSWSSWSIFKIAQNQNIPVWGDIELFARVNTVPVIGVTGTNGKSTVTCLLESVFKTAGYRAKMAGNIGEPVLDFIDFEFLDNIENQYNLFILELSSYQLETTESLSLMAGVILNISSDHLDRYDYDFEKYRAAKLKLLDLSQTGFLPKGLLVDNDLSENPRKNKKIKNYAVSELLEWEPDLIRQLPKSVQASGQHYLENCAAVFKIAQLFEISKKHILQVFKNFSGLPHRCQNLGQDARGVVWINDSKGTNIGAAQAALESVSELIMGNWVILLGGRAKPDPDPMVYNNFIKFITQRVKNLKAVICFGESRDFFVNLFNNPSDHKSSLNIHKADKFDQAMMIAQQIAQTGDGILLSPAGASLDEFSGYAERGKVFMTFFEQAFSAQQPEAR